MAKILKAKFPNLKVFAVEPVDSAVISGKRPVRTLFRALVQVLFPEESVDTAPIDGVIQIEAEAAKEYARRAACEEGLLVGISSGAPLANCAKNTGTSG
ncbi:cysteine synthase A [Oligella ureolytica]